MDTRNVGTVGLRVLEQIRKAEDPEEKKRLALEFFANQDNYRYRPIGWAEDYMPVRDDGPAIVKTAGITYKLNSCPLCKGK